MLKPAKLSQNLDTSTSWTKCWKEK